MSPSPAPRPKPIPAARRSVIAALAAAWVRERGTLPPSMEALVEWGAEDSGVSLEDELARLEGRVPPSQLRAREEYVRTSGVVITEEAVAAVGAEIDAARKRARARLRRARRARKA
jgi:hypothetical protein